MSDNSADVREDAKKRASNVVSDRLKDGFYGYLVTAFFIGNWQNIFMLFKSKKPIEETIKNITSQPDFLTQYFWSPILWGTVAAFIMPWVIVLYVRLVAKARSQIKSAEKAADIARENKLAAIALDTQEKIKKEANLIQILEEQKQENEKLKQEIAGNKLARSEFDNYFDKLNSLYTSTPKIENAEQFAHFFKKANENGIFQYYKGLNLAEQLMSGNMMKVIDSQAASPQITTKTPQM
ncbi:Uncharacterised protein [Citrobacter werkmanii]|uniref:Uncharacterized protein n=1 Tax=Citrobacter werkmanii TaxID=67827 RepID=A0A9N8GTZ6_9ENTR|nr:hypothetical protein [Citrobacter werkmanii]CAB5548461.1 Uncharacterised protein [Citrobacter werkmanii]CAB5576513.1 Uncharacterised protein [Citrobacter werkmanii]CAB5590352.1 Uncharacterised protein [Citrobacter werkmanii]CAB5592861.1 Uncharacterised protein [Citrobacter werkmanii]CAB5593179.1 Uncharacterised protein [Citrobacter werkmanii]